MTIPDLPAEVRALVHGPVCTIAHVELLLALWRAEPDAPTLEYLLGVANLTSTAGARERLRELAVAGLAVPVDGDAWRFAPQSTRLRLGVDQLAAMYNAKPVTLVRALYERPVTPEKSFTDTLRLLDDD